MKNFLLIAIALAAMVGANATTDNEDVNGRIVLQEKGKKQYNLDMSGLLPGQYIVSAYQDGHRNSTVVIKK